jgi:hypothetical protein
MCADRGRRRATSGVMGPAAGGARHGRWRRTGGWSDLTEAGEQARAAGLMTQPADDVQRASGGGRLWR